MKQTAQFSKERKLTSSFSFLPFPSLSPSPPSSSISPDLSERPERPSLDSASRRSLVSTESPSVVLRTLVHLLLFLQPSSSREADLPSLFPLVSQMLFVVSNPEVYKSASSDIYIVYGEAKVRSPSLPSYRASRFARAVELTSSPSLDFVPVRGPVPAGSDERWTAAPERYRRCR